MHKRILAIVTLLCAIPLLAFAGTGLQQINTWVRSPGGSLQVNSYAAQTVKNGSLWQSYSSSTANNTVTITPASGYFVNSLIIDGVPSTYSGPITLALDDAAPSIWVDFLRSQLSFTVNTGTGYIVFPSGAQPNVFGGPTYRVFEFIPAKGQYIATIVASPSANVTMTTTPATLPAAANQKVIVMVSNISGTATLSATVGGTAAAVNLNGMGVAQSNRTCDACHIAQGLDPSAAIYKAWSTSAHNNPSSHVPLAEYGESCSTSSCHHVSCATCHQGASTGAHPGQPQCSTCHNALITPAMAANWSNSCAFCHAPAGMNNSTIHNAAVTANGNNANAGCIVCHSIAIPQHAADAGSGGAVNVNDNNGVRAITTEFAKWSHHVTGVTLNDAHCVACHLEGTVAGNRIVVDATKHMVDTSIHLRNVNNDSEFKWTPEAPNFTGMDNFCMACHSSTGATSVISGQIQALFTNSTSNTPRYNTGYTASATNPFGDTISNQYDKMQRSAVVDVTGQFATSNPSHHAVMGKRYSGRTRVGATRTISSTTFTANSSATLPGPRTTIYDAGKFNPLYVTLANASGETGSRNGGSTLGDDSTLHCADCHTVGQYAARGSVAYGNLSTAFGGGITNFYKTAIGAHGSNNEYMLRNNGGSDAHHLPQQYNTRDDYDPTVNSASDPGWYAPITSLYSGKVYNTYQDTYIPAEPGAPYLVCYNCHNINNYGNGNSHVSEQIDESNCNAAINTWGNYTASGNQRLTSRATAASFNVGTPNSNPGGSNGNIYGIQCANCHNNGVDAGNIFGGIHGAKATTYTDGVGNTTKHERFLPGLGNIMYVPGTKGGIFGGYSAHVTMTYGAGIYNFKSGGTTSDLNWEEEQAARYQPAGSGRHTGGPAGCYTISNGTLPAADETGVVTGVYTTGNPSGALVPAAAGITAPGGQAIFGNWGGCADHAQAPATTVRDPRNGNTSIRPVTY
ncbi:MAG: hypothetical protein P4L44_08285 [Oryzomonas sp.]|uniref:hypothetical protein n=1 Tax=Oryzomonas sp. TaxID=2855186 RepID=UPI00284222B1|nr:hypothetical protein [Oryzomonas sp.]MDR3579943.1 hypothetical protein [Oryzomonas sp.]